MIAEIISLTKQLVAFQTFHPNFAQKRACLDFIKNLVKDDLHVQDFEFNGFPSLLISNTPGVHFDLLLSGHIDVVSAPESMFTLTEKDGKLFGRGVYDMKGAVVVMLLALQDYARKNENRKKKNIGLLLTSDEEIDGQNGTKAVLEKTNLTADFALLPDNGQNWEIMTAERGLVHARVSPSAKEAAVQALSKHFPQRGNENTEWITTFSVEDRPDYTSKVSPAGDSLEVDIRVRFINAEDEKKSLEILKNAEIIRWHKGAAVSEENPHVLRLQRIVREQTGFPADFAKECRTNESDAIYFAEQNIPAALVRPLGGGMHGDKEWIDVQALNDFAQILELCIMKKWVT